MHAGQEVVFLVVEYVVVDGDAGGYQFGDAALDEFLGQFRVFELFADGDPFAGAYQFGQIGVEGVVGETGQLDILGGSVGASGEGDAQYFRCRDGVVGKGFVKVSYPEQQYGIGVNGFHLDVLLHERGFDHLFCHGISCFDEKTKVVKSSGNGKPAKIFCCAAV